MDGIRDFTGKTAVVTGGGTGMGRELVRQLVAEGCNVAMCDVLTDTMAETKRLCEAAGMPQGTRLTAHRADVSNEEDVLRFASEVAREHDTDRIHLLFNNAGVGGGASFVKGSRAEWERTFDICWYGVYYSCRAFLAMLLKADRAHVTNTSSVNGFYASIGATTPHTAYPAAKFAVKGFTEGLITDFRLNAPHITASVVMPGHVGTSIVANSRRVLSGSDEGIKPGQMEGLRARFTPEGAEPLSDEQVHAILAEGARRFRENAPLTAAGAATIILNGVRENQWRILVGEDAKALDESVRADPWHVYDPDYVTPFAGTLRNPAAIDKPN